MERHGPVSVVILTRDDADHIAECLDQTLAQLGPRDEIVLVDSGSSDGTVRVCAERAERHPGRVRVHAFPEDPGRAAARETALELATHDVLLFLDADAVPGEGWLDTMAAALENADIVYGRQRHAPTRANAATVARGLRYHRFERAQDELPEAFASSANAGFRRFAFQTLTFDDGLPAAEDAAFARRARLAGLRLAYAPKAVVHHKDVASVPTEWRRRLREGAARARLRGLLGAPTAHLAWATAVGALAIAAVALASAWLLAATVLVFFAPTLRRLVSPAAKAYRPHALAGGAALAPWLDLAFVASYLTRRAARRE